MRKRKLRAIVHTFRGHLPSGTLYQLALIWCKVSHFCAVDVASLYSNAYIFIGSPPYRILQSRLSSPFPFLSIFKQGGKSIGVAAVASRFRLDDRRDRQQRCGIPRNNRGPELDQQYKQRLFRPRGSEVHMYLHFSNSHPTCLCELAMRAFWRDRKT